MPWGPRWARCQGAAVIPSQNFSRTRDHRAGVELAGLVVAAVVISVGCIHLGLGERLGGALDRAGPFVRDGVVILALAVTAAATVFARRRQHDAESARSELARVALHDGLTGLPNRRYLTEWLETELVASHRAGARVALLVVDLDRFELIADTHGHRVGDAVLRVVADRLRSCVTDPGDRVVRHSAHEFAVTCRDDPLRPLVTTRLAGRVLSALEEPVEVGRESLRVTASVGIALSTEKCTVAELVRDADCALRDAEARGDGRPAVFDPTVDDRRSSRAGLEPHLQAAARGGGFRLAYQPVVDVTTGEIVAAEALLRWDHPERGAVPPTEFVPVLEDTGLIVEVGAWVVREAIAQAHRWHEENPDRAPIRVMINVSARQLAQTGFAAVVREALVATPAPPGSVCLELTEGALMVDVDAAWSALRLLKRLGVQLALDDFGTGYSSLSYIRRFSLDVLKIDRSFVEGLGSSFEDTAIVEHVIGMARGLGMVTIGEGVERPVQLAELERLGCDMTQGFLLSEPLPAEGISVLLTEGASLGPFADRVRRDAASTGRRDITRPPGLVPFSVVDTVPEDRMIVLA